MLRCALALCAALAIAIPASAKDSLGVYAGWAAFRDSDVPRCYAIGLPRDDDKRGAYASLGTWPARKLRNQLHVRLSRSVRKGTKASLRIGSNTFQLTSNGRNAWAQNARMDTAIADALRSSTRMSVSARAPSGRRFTDRYDLEGLATAMDAAVVGCARLSKKRGLKHADLSPTLSLLSSLGDIRSDNPLPRPAGADLYRCRSEDYRGHCRRNRLHPLRNLSSGIPVSLTSDPTLSLRRQVQGESR